MGQPCACKPSGLSMCTYSGVSTPAGVLVLVFALTRTNSEQVWLREKKPHYMRVSSTGVLMHDLAEVTERRRAPSMVVDMPKDVQQRYLASLSENKFSVVTHFTGAIFQWQCLLENWLAGLALKGFPGAQVTILCMDKSAVESCASLGTPAALRAVSCVNATSWGDLLFATSQQSSHDSSGSTVLFHRDLYFTMTWAKPVIVHTATSHGFPVVYCDADIIFRRHLLMNESQSMFEMKTGNSGLVVAPAWSDVPEKWYRAARSMTYTRKIEDGREVNCCDQDALMAVLPHAASAWRTWPIESIPECAGKGPGSGGPETKDTLAMHYNCIGDTTDEGRMTLKAREMRRHQQWLVTEGICANYAAQPST